MGLLPLTWAKQKGRERTRSYTGGGGGGWGSPACSCCVSAPVGMCALPGPCKAQGRGGRGHSPQWQGQKGRRQSPANLWNEMLQPTKPCGTGLWTYVDIQRTNGWVFFFSKATALRFKAFLPVRNKWCQLWKTQQRISLLMQAIAITYFKTCFKILWRVVFYWPKNAKQT